jgi:dGTPase
VQSRGRRSPEIPSPLRTEFQRDRDRIIHCNAFRRLKHKTQVFIAPLGDHYVTRLTHTLEVSQIARTIARALNLNEDLTEAIALGHDLGHTPFGHIGEDELDRLYPQGFHHSRQSLRVVEQLEADGQGLNLTWEVRQGILFHSKPRGDFFESALPDGLTLEGQICRLSDAVAYLNHDLADAFRAGILANDDLPAEAVNALGRRHSERINTMVGDIVESSWAVSGQAGASLVPPPAITMSPEKSRAVNILREFMFERVYIPEGATEEGQAARRIIRLLYRHYSEHRDEIPVEFAPVRQRGEQAVVDYVAGMTDLYAIGVAERIEQGIATAFASR